jgi:putative CocE/NonD family hydrolase
MRRSVLLLVTGVAIVVLLVIALLAGLFTTNSKHKASVAGTVARSIPGEGATKLEARVMTPAGNGKHPLLVMPAGWGATREEYVLIGKRLVAAGYLVISYSQRGFGGSAGKVDLGGSHTQADLSAVITWGLKHTSADPKAIGAVGVSYGAGISLLAAAHDPRIKAVVALSGWSDLLASFYPNTTPSEQTVVALMGSANTRRRLEPDVLQFANQFLAKRTDIAAAVLASLAPSRSAMNDVAALNKNHPAVMIANAYQDTLFPPSQMVTYFNTLTVSKRLQLAVGDHGGPELAGLEGKPDTTWDDAIAWLDHYLRGKANGIQDKPAVHLQDANSAAWHDSKTWADTGNPESLYLGGAADAATGTLASAPATGWTTTISGGTDSKADAPPIQFASGKPYQTVRGLALSGVSRSIAGVWEAAAGAKPMLVNGAPTVHLTVNRSATIASLVAYLYDVDASGAASLMTYKPYSFFNLKAAPGKPQGIDIALEPISWTVRSGHHLSLVIDTVDPRFQSLSPRGSSFTFSSPAGSPSVLTVPIG